MRNWGSLLILGMATAFPDWMTWPVIPSPSLYFPFSMATFEMPWATSMLISSRRGFKIDMVPRTISIELERMSKTVYNDFFSRRCSLSALLISYKSVVSSFFFHHLNFLFHAMGYYGRFNESSFAPPNRPQVRFRLFTKFYMVFLQSANKLSYTEKSAGNCL